MKKIFTLAIVFALIAPEAYSRVTHRVARTGMPGPEFPTLAQERPFYVQAGYVGSSWADGGRFTHSGEFAFGMRTTDNMRVELNYIYTMAEYGAFDLTGHTVMLNAIMDGRIDGQLRWLHRQWFVPYVGVGAGISHNSISGPGTDLLRDIAPVVAIMTGFSIEFTDALALDIGYRYMYMIRPGIEIGGTDTRINPNAHQIRAGLRMHF